jgi:UDP-N-acetylglucosamine 2-epimerase (non-hydrolysing)
VTEASLLFVFGTRPEPDAASLTARILEGLEPVLTAAAPDMVNRTGRHHHHAGGSAGSFYRRIPAHVEAGLRTGDPAHPFPEEINRVLTGRLAELHFAPTAKEATTLIAEGVPEARIHITGNTGIDAVQYVRDAPADGTLAAPKWPCLEEGRRLIVVTSHRREISATGLCGKCERWPESLRARTCS